MQSQQWHSPWPEFLFSRLLIFIVARSNYGDMPGYFESISKSMAKGTPYGLDGFGYPALAFLFTLIPWLLGGRSLDLYFAYYRAQCFVVDAALFYILGRRCSRAALLVYIAGSTLLGNLLYNRLDIALGLMIFVACVLEGRGSWNAGSVVLGASIAFKVIPIMLVPLWLVWSCHRSIAIGVQAFCLVLLGAGLPIGIGYALWGRDAVFFMGTHAERGVEVESIWASVQIVIMQFGLEGKTYFSAGSYNLSTPLEGVFRSVSHVVAGLAALWGSLIAFRLARRDGPFILALSSTLGALVVASKVFSPQYLLFFLPLLLGSLDCKSHKLRRVGIALTVACCGLTTWVYPYHEKELVALSPIATVPLLARNAIFILLVILLQVHAWRLGRAKRPKEDSESEIPNCDSGAR